MKYILTTLLFAAAVLCRAQSGSSGTWIVEGDVKLHGEPVSGAGVRIDGPSLLKGATTDRSGHYQVQGSFPGSYTITVQKDGTGGARPRTVNVLPGSHDQHVDIELMAEAVVSGRVLDSEKRPVPNAKVLAWVKSSKNGDVSFLSRGFESTDDTGSYRIAELGEGRYFLIAVADVLRPRKRVVAAENSPAEKPRMGTRRFSFYPGTSSWENSASLELRFGEQREGLDIAFEKTAIYCMFANVSSPSAVTGTAQTASLAVYAPIGSTFLQVAQGPIREGEALEICGLPPGGYKAVARTYDTVSKKATAFAKTEFMIAKRDVDLGTLRPVVLTTLRGSVTVKDAPRESQLPVGVTVTLDVKNRPITFGENRSGRVERTGQFSIEGAFVDDYSLTVTGLPEGYYVQMAQQQGRDVLRNSLRTDGAELRVVLGADGAVVSGQAVDQKNQPVPDAIVALMAEGQESGLVQQCDQRGQFKFASGVRPGRYRVIALSGLLAGEEQETDAIKSQLVHAMTVDLAPRQQATLSLTVRAAR